ncbi:CU044_5270 family protein [Kribbella swartbergensis]
MNELERIRKAFPEPEGPTAETTAAARRQVQQLIREAERPTRRRARARAAWVGTALTATTAVVTVVGLGVPLLRGSPAPEAAPATITPTAPRFTSASQVLIATAVQQETDEKVSGKFFRVRSLHIGAATRVGNPKYTLERRTIGESWMPMKPGVQSWFGWVDLGYRPAAPADVAKWRAQGSPRSWQLVYEEDPITMAPSEPVVTKMAFDEAPSGYYLTGGKSLTAQQIAALPTDPVKLRAVLARTADPDATAFERDYVVFAAAGRLLFEMPSPPKLRGAALRVLAALPGTHVRTGVEDPIGRLGTEITIGTKPDLPSGGKTFMIRGGARYIIDPATGRLLSSTYGGKLAATVVLESGWTDENPTPPSPAVR